MQLIPIVDNRVIMPLIGTIDRVRAQQVMEPFLEGGGIPCRNGYL